MRFATKEQLRNHLDWLFKKNRSKRARERGLAVGGSSRCWFEGLDDILGQGKGPNHANDEDQASGTTTPTLNGMEGGAAGKGGHTGSAILAQGASERCQACHEELESFWSDDQQSWMLKDAIRTDDNEVYHKTCVETLSTPRQSTDQLGEHVADEATVKVEQVAPAAEKETGVGEDVKMKVEAEGAKGEQQLENVKPIAVKAEQIADVARAAALDSAAVAKQEASPISKKRPRETGGSEVQAQDGMGRQQAADEGSPSKRAKSESNVE